MGLFKRCVSTKIKMVKKGKKIQKLKFSIKCAKPVEDEIFDIASFEKFLKDRIKVNGGKAGQFGDAVAIERSDSDINVEAKSPFSKRYLKYLTKKFLKKQQLRDYIRVVCAAKQKSAYELKYFNVHAEDD